MCRDPKSSEPSHDYTHIKALNELNSKILSKFWNFGKKIFLNQFRFQNLLLVFILGCFSVATLSPNYTKLVILKPSTPHHLPFSPSLHSQIIRFYIISQNFQTRFNNKLHTAGSSYMSRLSSLYPVVCVSPCSLSLLLLQQVILPPHS